MIQKVLAHFDPRSQPWMSRPSFSHELTHALTFPVALAMVEGGVVGVFAKKTFGVSPMLFATIMAAPMFANLTSFAWARLARGRPKVRFINALQLGTLASIAAIALLPTGGIGPGVLTLLVILSRCLQTGIVTIRSTVWRMNYPRRVRARITGRLALINSMILATAPLIGYAVLDWNVQAFRVVYPASILVAMVGVGAFSRVRLRGERDLLRYEAGPTARPQPHGIPAPIYEYDPAAPNHSFWDVLRRDHHFRRYLLWQFIAGASNMMSEVVVIYLIVDLTSKAKIRFEYLTSIMLATAIPMLLAMLTLPLWARYLDRVHVTRFRSRQGWFWIGNQLGNWLGAATGSLTILGIARVLHGVARGGGMLAWNLGHNDFADRRMVTLYMGIHVTLTGVRGAVAPFLAMLLFAGWPGRIIPVLNWTVPAFDGIGHHLFLATAALALIGEIGFASLNRRIEKTG